MFSFKRPSAEPARGITMIKTASIRPNPRQPRRRFREEGIVRLADSISRHGILQPLCVRLVGQRPRCTYELIAGERRLRAASLIGMEYVPCILMDHVDDAASAQYGIIENLQREELNCFEQAEAMEQLMRVEGLSAAEVSAVLSLSPSAVSNKLRLLKLSAAQKNAVLDLGLSERHARAVLRLKDDSYRTTVLNFAGQKGLSVRECEQLVEEMLRDPEGTTKRLCAPSSPAPDEQAPKARPIRKFVVKDVRIFINSVDKAVRLIRESGISVSADKKEEEDFVEYCIRVPKVTA